MPRVAEKEVPRWKQRGKNQRPGFTPVQVNGRHAKAYARELARLTAQQQAGNEGRKEGTGNATLARTGAWRFRRHLPPFAWLVGLLITGAILHATAHPLAFGLLASIVIPALMTLTGRVRSRWTTMWTLAAAAATSLWLPFLAVRGLGHCVTALLITWAPFAALWVRRYRWRPAAAEKQQEQEAATGDVLTWDKLAAKRRWTGQLASPETIPGGRKWQIELDGTETHIGQVLSEPRAIAAAWGKPMTEAYAEPDPYGVESRGILTVLNGGTLEEIQDWNGVGFDAEGIGRIGRFADGAPARIRILVPMDGTRHSLIAGTSGAGKSALLDLIIWLALTSPVPIVPVILDPQNGQSLPQWRDKVLYAAGIDECARMNRGLLGGMMNRSERMSKMTWNDEGHKVKGMPFFDARLSGLPVVMVITDEAPVLLSGGGNAKLAAEMVRVTATRAKLGRKAGDTEELVAQLPSLGELGDQALRAQLVGGNVVAQRTAEKVSAGMLGLQADPSALPKYFANGKPTQGLGFVISVDGRQAPFRSDLVPRAMRHESPEVPVLEDAFLEAMDLAMGGVSPTATVAPLKASVPAQSAPRPVPEPEPAEDGPEGRRCADAVWQVLSDRGGDMDRGEIIKWVSELAVTGWGRAKPFSIKAIGNALRDLVDGKEPGRSVVKPQDGKPIYRAVTVQSPANDTK